MITQCSVFEGALKSLSESPLKALNGNQTTYPAAQFKTIRFWKTIADSQIQDLIDDLRSNADAIMALTDWGQAFGWDFDVNPVLDIHHSMNLGAVINSSGYNQSIDNPPSPHYTGTMLLFEETAFNLSGGGWEIETYGPIKKQVSLTWVLYEGPAKMLHNYAEFIGDPSYIQPGAPLSVPLSSPVWSSLAGFGSTLVPVTVLDPIPFQRPYKIPIPDHVSDYLQENNLFQAK